MNGIFEKLYDMTAFSNIVAEPQFLVMYVIAFVLLYLGIKKQYEPLYWCRLPLECCWLTSPVEEWE